LKEDDDFEVTCIDMDDGRLVFAPRETLTEVEKERADLHLGCCPACQIDLDFEYFYEPRFAKSNSRL
jgi:hypothetical protein